MMDVFIIYYGGNEMKTKLKKISLLAFAVFLVLTLPLAAGGGQGRTQANTSRPAPDYVNLTGYPIVKSPITITVTGGIIGLGTSDWNNTDFVQIVGERFGIKMDCSPYNAEAWPTQFTLLLSSGDFPDLLLNVGQPINTINEYGGQGFFLPFNEYLEYMSNLRQKFDEFPGYQGLLSDGDNNIYGFTKINSNPITQVTRNFIFRAWLERLGLQLPKTVDELYTVLRAFKDRDANGNGDPNDEIPLSTTLAMVPIQQAFGIPSTSEDYTPLIQNGQVFLGYSTDEYKAFLKYMNRLFVEGLYDRDALIQTDDQFNAKMREERIGMFSTGGAPYVYAGRDISYDKDWYWIGGLTSDYNRNNTVVINSPFSTNVVLVANRNTRYPEAIARFVDYAFSDEGISTTSIGFEGVSFDYVNYPFAPNYPVYEMRMPAGYTSGEQYRTSKAVIGMGLDLVQIIKNSLYGFLIQADDNILNDERVLIQFGWAALMEKGRRQCQIIDGFPPLVYTPREAAERATLVTDLQSYLSQSRVRFISGEDNIDSEWNNYLRTLEQMELRRLLAIEQAAYDRQYK